MVLQAEKERERAALVCMYPGEAMRGQREKVPPASQGEVSAEPDSASTSISGFQSPNRGEIHFCCLAPSPSQFGAPGYGSTQAFGSGKRDVSPKLCRLGTTG